MVPGGRRLLCHPALPSSSTSEPCTSSSSTSPSRPQRCLTEISASSQCSPTALPASLRPSHHQLWHPSHTSLSPVSPLRLQPPSTAASSAAEDHPWSQDAKMGTIPLFFSASPSSSEAPALWLLLQKTLVPLSLSLLSSAAYLSHPLHSCCHCLCPRVCEGVSVCLCV